MSHSRGHWGDPLLGNLLHRSVLSVRRFAPLQSTIDKPQGSHARSLGHSPDCDLVVAYHPDFMLSAVLFDRVNSRYIMLPEALAWDSAIRHARDGTLNYNSAVVSEASWLARMYDECTLSSTAIVRPSANLS